MKNKITCKLVLIQGGRMGTPQSAKDSKTSAKSSNKKIADLSNVITAKDNEIDALKARIAELEAKGTIRKRVPKAKREKSQAEIETDREITKSKEKVMSLFNDTRSAIDAYSSYNLDAEKEIHQIIDRYVSSSSDPIEKKAVNLYGEMIRGSLLAIKDGRVWETTGRPKYNIHDKVYSLVYPINNNELNKIGAILSVNLELQKTPEKKKEKLVEQLVLRSHMC